MRVPARDTRHRFAKHGVEPALEVLDRARKNVMNTRTTVGGRRSFIKNKGLSIASRIERLLKEVFFAPCLENLTLDLVEIRMGERFETH